jgi:hypothetical protein
MNTGWLADGMWVAITLDNVAEAHLARGNGDAAARYLYATLNHGTPLYTWCEERGPEPGSPRCTGDRQHLWTPVAVVRAIRDCLVMEDGVGLHLALGADREWLSSGQPVGIRRAATHFGPISYQVRYDKAHARLAGRLEFSEDRGCGWVRLHVRLPDRLGVVAVDPQSTAEVVPGGEALQWESPRRTISFAAVIGKSGR